MRVSRREQTTTKERTMQTAVTTRKPKVGDRVIVRGTAMCEGRITKIKSINKFSNGQVCYIMQDGGWFSANEFDVRN